MAILRAYRGICAGATSVSNSDAMGLWESGGRTVAVVCDGVSSAPRGGDAARLTVQLVMDACREETNWSAPLPLAQAWGLKAHRQVADRFGHSGLCTLVLAIVADDHLRGVYVGDSACLVITQGGEVTSLTEPHRKSVLRRLNGKPVLLNGMPVFDQWLTRVVGQSEPLVLDSFERPLAQGDWIACFTDGVEDARVEAFVRQGYVNQDSVKALVAECSEQTEDDATLILLQAAEPVDMESMASDLAAYAALNPDNRSKLIERLGNATFREDLPDRQAALLAAFAAEADGRRAEKLARLILSAGAVDRETAVRMLDQAVLRRQAAAARTIKAALSVGWIA